jgi:hypothetical protein
MGYALPRRENESVQVGLAVRDINHHICLTATLTMSHGLSPNASAPPPMDT